MPTIAPPPAALDAWRTAPAPVRLRARWELQTRYPEPRPEQLTPPGTWEVWLFLAGRGAGKTRSAAEDVVDFARKNPGARIGVVAQTFQDGVDVCFEGESGILSVLDESEYVLWNRSKGELLMHNGSRFKIYSDERPRKLRGPQHHRVWVDEMAAFKNPLTWDMLLLGCRLGDRPQIVVTTTPDPKYLPLRELLEREDGSVVVTKATTYANRANLAASFIAGVERLYAGTRLGRQELLGEMLGDVEGALWNWGTLDATRLKADALRHIPADQRGVTVVGIDPAATVTGDETGIITAMRFDPGRDADVTAALGITENLDSPHALILADDSGHYTPGAWAKKAIAAYRSHQADRLVPERNNGGDMVAHTIRTESDAVPIRPVWASKGKQTRAEPVAALYEQGRVHHVGAFTDLEGEQTTWVPGEDSPNRMDALVWAVTDLLVEAPPVRVGARGDQRRAESLTGDLLEARW